MTDDSEGIGKVTVIRLHMDYSEKMSDMTVW